MGEGLRCSRWDGKAFMKRSIAFWTLNVSNNCKCCYWEGKHTAYVVLVWVTSSLLLNFLIDWRSRAWIVFYSSCHGIVASLIRMTIWSDIYLIYVFCRSWMIMKWRAPIQQYTKILIRNTIEIGILLLDLSVSARKIDWDRVWFGWDRGGLVVWW